MIRLNAMPAVLLVCCVTIFLWGCGGSSSSHSSATWNITMTNTPATFIAGQVGSYTITVSNSGSGPTIGNASVTDGLPSGLAGSNMSGAGWTCTSASATCSRSDTLAAGGSYPTINLTVNVAQTAQGTLTNQATISGGAASNAVASVATPIGSPTTNKISHVVVIFQENRTPDNLFHDPVLMSRGADIATSGQTSTGQTITLTPVSLQTTYDLSHTHDAFLDACQWNGVQCQMNGSDLIPCSPTGNCPTDPQFQYVQASDIQPYFTMAETYTFGDRMFQTNEGPSFPAHQYILSGTSAVCVPGGNCPSGTTSSYNVSDNPGSNTRPDGTSWAGCLAPPGSMIDLIDTSQPFPNSTYPQLSGPECFEHPTLTDLLDQAGLTWKYYAPAAGSIWTSPNVIEHMCQPTGSPDETVCSGPDWTNPSPNVVIEGTGAQVVSDIQNGQLASVTWVIPDGAASDHADSNEGLGPSWVASIVNTIGQSPFWNNTAIIITWDDWGGWYDHVAPTLRNTNSYEYGLRVPLIVISPYAKAAYISHQYNDFGSILRFVEEQFSLPEIEPSVGYADSYALGDLSDCFDFTQTPLAFAPIPSAQDAEFFIHKKGTPTPPDND